MEYVALDAHKHYSVASVEGPTGERLRETRLAHHRGAIRAFLEQCTPGSPVAVETVGNWYWLVDEIEEAGMVPRLVHARKAKVMLGMINKTDKLDVRGLNRLQRTGTPWTGPGLVDTLSLEPLRLKGGPPDGEEPVSTAISEAVPRGSDPSGPGVREDRGADCA